jgi:hypothetical protein
MKYEDENLKDINQNEYEENKKKDTKKKKKKVINADGIELFIENPIEKMMLENFDGKKDIGIFNG